MRYAQLKYAKCLFTNIQKQMNMLKVAYFLRKRQTLWSNNTRIHEDLECEIFRILFLY